MSSTSSSGSTGYVQCSVAQPDCGGHADQVVCAGVACVCTVDATVVQTAVSFATDPCSDVWTQCFVDGTSSSSSGSSSNSSGGSSGSTGSTGNLTCLNTGTYARDDARSICFVFCASDQSSSDATCTLTQDQQSSGTFTAHVTQTVPTPADETFSQVTASFSGDFFNFDDMTLTSSTYDFHELVANGQTSDANLEVYTNPNTEMGGPVNTSTIQCVELNN